MGSMIYLALGRLEVDWGKNNFYTDHSQLFQPSDLKPVPYYYAGDDWPNDEPIVEFKEGFAKPLRHVVDRLELLGYTIESARQCYENLHRFHGIDDRPLPFETLAKALADVDVTRVSGNYAEDHGPGEFVRREIIDRLSEHSEIDIRGLRSDHWEIDLLLENFSVYSALRLLAENPANLDLDVSWGFSDVVENGWVTREAFKRGPLWANRFLIVTEGSSDAKILRHAIGLFRPHISDFFRFVDMEEGYPFSGTGNLFRFTQGLVSIGIQNNGVIVYDNDAEGCAKLDATQKLNLPANLRAIRLPNLADFTDFPTIGPNGKSRSDINGRAASIECYLDLHREGFAEPLVRWSAFNRSVERYQGELEQKSAYLKDFLDIKVATSDYNATAINAVLDVVIAECVRIAETKMSAGA